MGGAVMADGYFVDSQWPRTSLNWAAASVPGRGLPFPLAQLAAPLTGSLFSRCRVEHAGRVICVRIDAASARRCKSDRSRIGRRNPPDIPLPPRVNSRTG